MYSRLVVVGLGYVGLPLAYEATMAGLEVTGLDVSAPVVDLLNRGSSHIDDLSDTAIRDMLDRGFSATTDSSVLQRADVAVICVPTPLSAEGGPDLTAVIGAAQSIAEWVHKSMLVVLESTTYPGTTDEVLRPLLEAGGLTAGSDFHLAFSPERIDPGNPTFGAKNTPKVVGGHTNDCTLSAARFYEQFIDTVVKTRGTREAEMAKLLENTYRHVNIALVNEMARFCHDLDIDLWSVIEAASSKPFGFHAFYPGPGVGGHCIPIDPNYLSHNVQARLGYPFRFVELAQEINSRMPAYVVERVQDILNERALPLKGSRILLLGITYKADISDQRESPATSVAEKLLAKGALVEYHDPFVDKWTLMPAVKRASSAEDGVVNADLTILMQAHRSYDVDALASLSPCFFDSRGVVTDGNPCVVKL